MQYKRAMQRCSPMLLLRSDKKTNTVFFLTTKYNKNLELIFLNALTINFARQKNELIIHHSSFNVIWLMYYYLIAMSAAADVEKK